MESLIAKQHVSRRFRRLPEAKRPSPLFSFGLSGQKPGKRPAPPRREAGSGILMLDSRPRPAAAPSAGPSRRGSAKPAKAPFAAKAISACKALLVRLAGAGRPSPGPSRDSSRAQPPEKRLLAVALSFSALALILALALATVRLSDALFPVREADFALPVEGQGLDLLTLLEDSQAEDPEPANGMVDTELPLSLSVEYYTLQRGETVDAVAKRFGRDRDSIVSMNGIVDASRVPAGTKLKIPNMNGIIHVVKAGDSLGKIASHYKSNIVSILDANNLESYSIRKGQSLFIPGGKLDKPAIVQAIAKLFSWPVRGVLTSFFAYRMDPFTGVRRFHNALDIAGTMGQRVNAASEGKVVETGYNVTFGNYIILSHGSGYQTFYAHLSKILVAEGQKVAKGDKIAEMGNTGYSTGTHLHFGVYKNGNAVNPLKYLSK